MSAASSTFEITGPWPQLGDHVSMEVTPRLGWRGRLMVRLGLRTKPEPEFQTFVVTRVFTSSGVLMSALTNIYSPAPPD